jgi:hypothetical protein
MDPTHYVSLMTDAEAPSETCLSSTKMLPWKIPKNVLKFDNKFRHNILDVAIAMVGILAISRSSEECGKVFNELSKPSNTVEDIEQ